MITSTLIAVGCLVVVGCVAGFMWEGHRMAKMDRQWTRRYGKR
jgi:hypothetical protein